MVNSRIIMKQYCMVQYTPQIIIILKQVLVKKSAYYTQVNTVMFLISLCIVRDQKKRAALESRAGTPLSLTTRVSV